MSQLNDKITLDLIKRDRQVVWHPYSVVGNDLPLFPVVAARGCKLRLADGRELVDGMSSWWCAIHGYHHDYLNHALQAQLDDMAHVMFGGLTHPPAIELCERLVAITPEPLQQVFLADSGSVSVEVAMKLAIQYWHAKGKPTKQRFLTVRGGYHGDTFDCMSVCDPVNGMHTLFDAMLPRQLFAERPACRFDEPCRDEDVALFASLIEAHRSELAAVILEPIVQGAGGMWFYSPEYLQRVRALCDRHGVLLILDEIATGFGRTGKLFACEHAGISPDILCLGKALTGGYMTLAATLTTREVSQAIAKGEPGLFMHGPTFMGNPLACAVALASLELLAENRWPQQVADIEQGLRDGLAPCAEMSAVADVRVLGAIGVVELKQPVDMRSFQPRLVAEGVWVRPFGKLVYLMPPFVISATELEQLTSAICRVVAELD